jgi:hypothetical protein
MPATSVRAAAVSASMRCNWLLAVAAARALSSSLDRHSRSEKPASCASRPSWVSTARASRRAMSFCRCRSIACSSARARRPGARAAFLPSFVGTLDAGLLGFLLALAIRPGRGRSARCALRSGPGPGPASGPRPGPRAAPAAPPAWRAAGAELALAVGQVLLRRAAVLRAPRPRRRHGIEQLRGQFVDLALALDDAVGLGIRNVERQAGRRQQMAGTRHAAVPPPAAIRLRGRRRRQRRPAIRRARRPSAGRRSAPCCAGCPPLRRCRRVSGSGQRQNCRRRRRQRRTQAVGVGDQRREALAQHRLDGGFPAGLDLDRLPQRLGIGQTARLEPVADLAARATLACSCASASWRARVSVRLRCAACNASRAARSCASAAGYGGLQRRQLSCATASASARVFASFDAASSAGSGAPSACLSCSSRVRRCTRFSSARWAWPRRLRPGAAPVRLRSGRGAPR